MKKLVLFTLCLSPILMMNSCDKSKTLSREDFYTEYQKRLDNFDKLGEIYKSVETDKDDFYTFYDLRKVEIKSTAFAYIEEDKKVAIVNYFADEAQSIILSGSVSGLSMTYMQATLDSFETLGFTLTTSLKDNYLIIEGKYQNDTTYYQKIDENCYTVEIKLLNGDLGYSIHNNYKK